MADKADSAIRRQRFRLRLGTCVAIMIAAALMLGVNTRPYPPNWMVGNLFVPLDYEIVLDHYGQGWPATFRIYSTDPMYFDQWFGWALAGDGLSAFAVIVTVAAPVEWWLRRRERAR